MNAIPPEVLFDRCFYDRQPRERRRYRGKADLATLQGCLIAPHLLEELQRVINQALGNARQDDPAHVAHGTFHFDYVDSDYVNALAFSAHGYAFIGVTIALINRLWETSSRLAHSPDVATVLLLPLAANRELVATQLFRLQLFFIVGHEWSHHVFGHPTALVLKDGDREPPVFLDEIQIAALGGFESQTREVVVDGYSAYYTLTNLVIGDERPRAMALLAIQTQIEAEQDSILLACFIVAIAGFMFTSPPIELTAATAYATSHPAQALRLRLLIESAGLWAAAYRPNLSPEIAPDRFRTLFRAVATATWGMNGGTDWSNQIAFLVSNEGDQYAQRLIASRNAAVQALGLNAPERDNHPGAPRNQ